MGYKPETGPLKQYVIDLVIAIAFAYLNMREEKYHDMFPTARKYNCNRQVHQQQLGTHKMSLQN